MASKDLVKRAFSVTANLHPPPMPDPTPTPSKGEGGVPEASAQSAPKTQAAAPIPAPAGAPKTGPGSMLAFMTEQSEVHREVVLLREQVTQFEGADVAKRLDPKEIVASKWANRDNSHFDTESFARLKKEIAGAGGNVQPIKVRSVANSAAGAGAPPWEIVFGHRRHRACLELGIPVLALIQKDMKDAELFVEMERENREREDLSAWEQGVMYLRALESGLFPSAKQLATAIDRDMSNISRAMALAKLPGEVVRAFGSPLNLQFRWATALKDAHQRDPEGLLSAARELTAKDPKPSPAEVFASLTQPTSSKDQIKGTTADWKDGEGKRVASMTTDRKGRVTLFFDQPMEEAQQRKFAKLVDSFLAAKTK